MEEKYYNSYDYNFNNYNLESLRLLTENKILLLTAFPKVIVNIYNHPSFKNWLSDNKIDISNEKKIIDSLIQAVKLRTENIQKELMQDQISLFDKDLWLKIVDQFLSEQQDNIKQNYRNYNLVIKRKKSLKKNNHKEIQISI